VGGRGESAEKKKRLRRGSGRGRPGEKHGYAYGILGGRQGRGKEGGFRKTFRLFQSDEGRAAGIIKGRTLEHGNIAKGRKTGRMSRKRKTSKESLKQASGWGGCKKKEKKKDGTSICGNGL